MKKTSGMLLYGYFLVFLFCINAKAEQVDFTVNALVASVDDGSYEDQSLTEKSRQLCSLLIQLEWLDPYDYIKIVKKMLDLGASPHIKVWYIIVNEQKIVEEFTLLGISEKKIVEKKEIAVSAYDIVDDYTRRNRAYSFRSPFWDIKHLFEQWKTPSLSRRFVEGANPERAKKIKWFFGR